MSCFNKFILLLKTEMTRPTPYGWFHLLWCFLTVIILIIIHNKKSEKSLKRVLGIYGFIALLLELLKQLSWSINLDNNIITWDYQWYSFPLQLCSTPIYLSIICFFLKESNFRTSLLSYMAYLTILGGIATILLPDSCFTKEILININTMWIHCGSLVVSLYLLMSGHVKPIMNNYSKAIKVFIFFIVLASLLNFIVYNLGILNDETFNMFFISPYFTSTLPIFNQIQQHTPYMIFLLSYFIILSLGGYIVFKTQSIISKGVLICKKK